MSEKNTHTANHTPGRTRNHRGPGPGGQMIPGEKAKDFKGTIKKMIRYLGQYKVRVLIVALFAVASTVFMIVGPKILGRATDELFEGVMEQITGSGEGIDFTALGRILLSVLGLYVLSAFFSYIQGFIMSGVTMKVTYNLRRDINDKIHRLPLSYYDTTTHGDVLSRITNDVDTITQTLNQGLSQIITSVVSLIGFLVMMLTISWQLTLVALCMIPFSMIAVLTIVSKSQKHFVNQQKYLGSVNGHIEEIYGAHVVMKAFNGQKDARETFDRYNDKLYNAAWRANFLSGLMMPITTFIGNLGYVGICILGGYFASNGTMTLGGIQSFIQYVRSFNQPIMQVANISNILQQTAAAAERVFEFLDEEEEIPESDHALSVNRGEESDTETCVHIDGSVKFENVTFGYHADEMIIHDFSASIKSGQKIAIVGPTGAGKTTIVKLLMRYYDLNNGKILVGGHDIADFKRDELRSLFGMVLQDTWLYNGTIADNIRYGKLDATDEEVKAAAKSAQADRFIRTLPKGYKMILNEEVNNVSQGQKQLLTIARAILADPEILILDEATSSVDTRTEVLIQKAMDNLMQGRTSFVIAHRLSTIRDADMILVMKDGDIAETGTHDELLEKGGFYAELYNSQFESAG